MLRFRPDGSRIEVFTRGQVNPFGIAVDPWFNLYTADCHSKPITQLIRGAVYQSFGKPHDGLGFAPHVSDHSHGSTALCGLTWYDADHFPEAYRGCMFLGNVVTNRVNFDRIEWRGSTPVAKEQPDFCTSPTSTTASSATTKSTSNTPAATRTAAASGGSCGRGPMGRSNHLTRPSTSRPLRTKSLFTSYGTRV